MVCLFQWPNCFLLSFVTEGAKSPLFVLLFFQRARALPLVSPMPFSSYGDEVARWQQYSLETVNNYLAAGCPDPDYFIKLFNTAAEWQQKYDDYLNHLRINNTSHHIVIR